MYGGLQILNGVLSDFHKISLNENATKFEWVEVPLKETAVRPGPRAKCGMFSHDNKIYLVAGIKSMVLSTNEIHQYDIGKQAW